MALSVDLRIFPERPVTMNIPLLERFSEVTVELELLDELSLLPHEIVPKAKPAINRVYKIFSSIYKIKYNT